MEKQSRTIAVIMQRRTIANRWESVQWEPCSALEWDEPSGAPRVLVECDGLAQWLHPGFEVTLHRDEAEGYYLNMSSGQPSVFVLWRMEAGAAVPLQVTASYTEGARWLDGGHAVDRVAMPEAMQPWVAGFVAQHYRPEPRKRIRPRSFLHPKDRMSG
jgi:hypothetical protein